ncbi:unnamed protein product [Clonostachys chloroleuca]|uniref:Uncharacterized protein n=1 Tax=Clonostachys chloroleuca TaxID=1926264 RepID=A0AA35LNX4_9HYPO|nr:unnamed protein product [Clonostachys chloroleuca]
MHLLPLGPVYCLHAAINPATAATVESRISDLVSRLRGVIGLLLANQSWVSREKLIIKWKNVKDGVEDNQSHRDCSGDVEREARTIHAVL